MNNKKLLMGLGIVLGIIFLIISLVYTTHTAGMLPHIFPGYEADSIHKHAKHAIAAFVIALLSFVFAWFQSGPLPTVNK